MSKGTGTYEERYEEFKKQRQAQFDDQAKSIEDHAQQTGIDLIHQIEQEKRGSSGAGRVNPNAEISQGLGEVAERVAGKVEEWRQERDETGRER